MKLSKSELLLRTRELRAGSVITESEIAALKRRWSPRNSGGDVAYEECDEFMHHGPYRISDEQGKKGFRYWETQFFTPTGKLRSTEFTRANFSGTVMHCINNYSHFTLASWHWEYAPNGGAWPFPVYRMHAIDGRYFDYVAKAWTSGGSVVL